jgi:glutaminase
MIANFLQELVGRHREDYRDGAVATYIPELATVDPKLLGIAMAFQDGRVLTAGDATARFAIESISKTVVLALALLDHGEKEVFARMREEPSGDAFNSIIKLQTGSAHVPSNPYVNAGAILTTSLIKGKDAGDKFQRILDFMGKISETPGLDLDRETYLSEKATGDTNRALSWMMKSYGDITGDVEEILDVYFRQCSIRITAEALARIGRFFAAGGVLSSGERVLTVREARIVVGLMATCGLYNGSGTYMVDVGIPTKSGVGGGLMAAYSGVGGIGCFSPALDSIGNSVAGQRMMRDLSETLGLDILMPTVLPAQLR